MGVAVLSPAYCFEKKAKIYTDFPVVQKYFHFPLAKKGTCVVIPQKLSTMGLSHFIVAAD